MFATRKWSKSSYTGTTHFENWGLHQRSDWLSQATLEYKSFSLGWASELHVSFIFNFTFKLLCKYKMDTLIVSASNAFIYICLHLCNHHPDQDRQHFYHSRRSCSFPNSTPRNSSPNFHHLWLVLPVLKLHIRGARRIYSY